MHLEIWEIVALNIAWLLVAISIHREAEHYRKQAEDFHHKAAELQHRLDNQTVEYSRDLRAIAHGLEIFGESLEKLDEKEKRCDSKT